MKALALLSILLVTNVALAQGDRVKGHIKPLPEEFLQTPVTLRCGVSIIENVEKRNGKLVRQELTELDVKTLDTVCSRVAVSYSDFLSAHHMGTQSAEKFHWEVSLLPDTKDYRCLNDTKYRFYSRKVQEGDVSVDGYTDEFQRYTFSLSNRNSKYFKTVFAHEVFHAMNYFNRISDTETLAEAFTAQLGYGR
jgi:hypothetical protein